MLLFGLDWRYRIHWPKNACDEETSTCGRGPDPQAPQDSTASIGWATGRTAQHWLKMFLLMVFQFVEHVALFQKLDTWIPQDPMVYHGLSSVLHSKKIEFWRIIFFWDKPTCQSLVNGTRPAVTIPSIVPQGTSLNQSSADLFHCFNMVQQVTIVSRSISSTHHVSWRRSCARSLFQHVWTRDSFVVWTILW